MSDVSILFLWELAGYSVRPLFGTRRAFHQRRCAGGNEKTAHGWREFADRIEIQSAPGDHHEFVQTHRRALFEKAQDVS